MNFKILIVGYGNEGKSSFVQRHKTGEFDRLDYDQEGTLLNFTTNHGPVTLQVKTSNLYESGPTLEEYDAEIIMLDLTRPGTIKIVETVPNTDKPRVVVGNKYDLTDDIRISRLEIYARVIGRGYQYYDISAKLNYNYEKPFLYLLKKLVNENLDFVEKEPLTPREVNKLLVETKC